MTFTCTLNYKSFFIYINSEKKLIFTVLPFTQQHFISLLYLGTFNLENLLLLKLKSYLKDRLLRINYYYI